MSHIHFILPMDLHTWNDMLGFNFQLINLMRILDEWLFIVYDPWATCCDQINFPAQLSMSNISSFKQDWAV